MVAAAVGVLVLEDARGERGAGGRFAVEGAVGVVVGVAVIVGAGRVGLEVQD